MLGIHSKIPTCKNMNLHTLIVLFFLVLIPLSVHSQTFHKIYEWDGNTDNELTAMAVRNGEIHTTIKHVCDPDTTDNRTIQCLGYSKMALDGQPIIKKMYDTFFPSTYPTLAVNENQVWIGSHEHGRSDYGRPITLLSPTNSTKHDLITSTDSFLVVGTGLDVFDNKVYFSSVEKSVDKSQAPTVIHKLGLDLNIIWSFRYRRGINNVSSSLQPTADGNLVFINKYDDGAGAQGENGVEIVKLDTNGLLVDTLVMPDLNVNGHPRLLAAKDGSIYFGSKNIIIPDVWPRTFNGTINKLSADLDSVIWSVPLPVKSFTNQRQYKFSNFLEASNGDILAVGQTWDSGADGPLINGHMHNFNGFAVRLDAETGDILWLRVYQHPIANPLLDPVEHGGYISGDLINIFEQPDGHFLVGGTAYYDPAQQSVLFPAGETTSFVWLMNIDENGCIDVEECSENIVLDGVYRPTDGFLPVISDDYTWTFRTFFGFGTSSFQERFAADSIWEAGWYFERFRSLNQDGSGEIVEGLYKESAGKLFKKTGSGAQEEILVFDITVLQGDTLSLNLGGEPAELYVESTDTVTFADGIPRKRATLRCTEFPDDYESRIWIEGLGDLSSDNPACILDLGTQLACYSDTEGIIYQADFAEMCWLTTSTTEMDSEQLRLYPNPAKDVLHLDVADGHAFMVRTIASQLIHSGTLSSGTIEVRGLPAGVYILELVHADGSRSVGKFIKQ